MVARALVALTCVMMLSLGELRHAQSSWRELARREEWMLDFTVVTMFGESWGASTSPDIHRAIARAITNCTAMSGTGLGCGAYLTSIRAGWIVGIRCGHENIIIAERDLVEAERRALRRESEMRTEYAREMPECTRVFTVDPSGKTMPPRSQVEGAAGLNNSAIKSPGLE